MEELFERIGQEIDIEKLSKNICLSYQLGQYIKYELIFVGVDDLSYYLHTSKGKYLVKIMNKEKTTQDINRFIQKNIIINKNCVYTPKIILHNYEAVFTYYINDVEINLIAMECIDGKDLYSINEVVRKEDIDKLINIIVPFHQMKEKIEIDDYDEYCFMKIKYDYEKTREYLPQNIRVQIEEAIKEFDKIDLEKLSKCFIHGDLISTNIMKDKSNDLWLIDFYQSGNGIRILDIVKILNSVIYNYQYDNQTDELEKYFLNKYIKEMPLSEYELEILPTIRKIDAITGIMMETYDKVKGKDSTENQYWLKNDMRIIKKLEK